jgi:hypothetical protein
MVTFRVLPRFILKNSPDLPAFDPSIGRRANVNFFLFKQFRTHCSLFCTRTFDNSFVINSFLTIWVKHRGWAHPPKFASSFQALTHSTRLALSPYFACARPSPTSGSLITSLLRRFVTSLFASRWSLVVFPRKTPSISFPFMSLSNSLRQNDGGYTHPQARLGRQACPERHRGAHPASLNVSVLSIVGRKGISGRAGIGHAAAEKLLFG